MAEGQDIRVVTPAMRRVLYVAGALVFGAGFTLTIFPETTDRNFAFTIVPPATAAFLGALYLAAGVVEVLSARERVWANARAAVPGVFVFTVLTAVVTVRGIDQLHLTRAAGWLWIGVYALVPPSMLWIWFRQVQARGGDPARSAPLLRPVRAGLGGLAALLLAAGLALTLVPRRASGLWPWELTPADAVYRTGGVSMEPYVGAWLIGLGLVAGAAWREGDARRAQAVLAGSVALGLLQATVILRFAGTIDWSHPGAYVYAAVVAGFFAVGILGLRAQARP